MKLVDILARELKVWPEGAAGYCVQSETTTQVFFGNRITVFLSARADYTEGVQVTRDQWQAAVDALATPEWDGTGLPPVGTVCGFCRFSETPGCEWTKVIIVAHWSEGLANPVAIFMSTSYAPQADQAVATCFRPIRSDDQIREAAIARLTKRYEQAAYTPRQMAEYAYDVLNYREAP